MKQCILAGLIILSVAACGGGDSDELSQSSASSSGPLARVSVAEIGGGVEENSDATLASNEVIAEAGGSKSEEPPKVWAVDGWVLAKLFDSYSYFISADALNAKIKAACQKANKNTPSGKKFNAIKTSILSRLNDFPTIEHARAYGYKQLKINEIISEINGILEKDPLPLNQNDPSMDFKKIGYFDPEEKKQKLKSAKRLIVLYKRSVGAGASDYVYITKCLRYMSDDDKSLNSRNSSDQKMEKGWYQIDSDRAGNNWTPLNVDNIDDWLNSDENVCEFMYFDEEGLRGVLDGVELLGALFNSEKLSKNDSLRKLINKSSRIYSNSGASELKEDSDSDSDSDLIGDD
ncbi:MAG: hypothetical protein ON057_000642 [Glomeribacter sp. 1016415]|nr:hypothetical protein [Glomeribacter sp. 1016415]